jgi:hypothetical protein
MKIKSFVAAAVIASSMVAPAMASTPAGQFADVQPSNWAYQSILNLRDKYGVVAGFPDGSFKPGQPATRAQLAALVSASLDRITEFSNAEDAYLAAALRAEFSKELTQTNARVSTLEVAAANKANGVNNYLGAGVLLNQQGVAGNGFDSTQTVSGATIQGRYAVAKLGNNDVSVRPYANFVGTPAGQIGSGGGATVTYDYSIAKKGGVSAANIYGGVGYQIPFVNNTAANLQSAVGTGGQAVFVLGAEGRLTDSLVGFADLKFPTTTAASGYGNTNGVYSPVFTTGLGFKF